MNEHLKRALEALERGAVEARAVSRRSTGELRDRLNRTVEEVLSHLEEESEVQPPEDTLSRLDRQSREIAEELRRVERLMKERFGRE